MDASMKSTIPFLLGIMLSASVNAGIIDLGNVTRDTTTGLEWLDLTETNNRTYVDISVNQLGAGGEFEGWRVATTSEALTLWNNFGITSPFFGSINIGTDDYADFLYAVSLLGNIAYEADPVVYDYGTYGITSDVWLGSNNFQNVIGAVHYPGNDIVNTHLYTDSHGINRTGANTAYGTYLVRVAEVEPPTTVPTPGTGSLALIALLGLFYRQKTAQQKTA